MTMILHLAQRGRTIAAQDKTDAIMRIQMTKRKLREAINAIPPLSLKEYESEKTNLRIMTKRNLNKMQMTPDWDV